MMPKQGSESRKRCSHGVAWNGRLCKQCHPELIIVYVPHALAQRILNILARVADGQEDSWTSTVAHAVEMELRKLTERRK